MKFSTKLPDKEGYYWVKQDHFQPAICRVLEHDGKFSIDEGGMFSVDVKQSRYKLFSGPIKEPK